MKLNREIMRVKAMLERAISAEEIARLTSLLISLQTEYIEYLEKKTVIKRRKADAVPMVSLVDLMNRKFNN